MKLLYILIFFLPITFINGQIIPKDSLTGKFKYDLVIQMEGLKKEDIYDRAKDWIIRTLKSSDNLINLDDANKNSINATGNILLTDQGNVLLGYRNVTVNFKFNIYCKDGRYKVIIDNFILNYDLFLEGSKAAPISTSLEGGFKKQGLYKGEKATERTHIEANEVLRKLISELQSAIETSKIENENSDW